MNRIVQFGVSAVAAAAIGIGAGSGIAAAFDGEDEVTGPTDPARAPRVAVPGGTAGEVETETGEGAAAYGVLVTRPDGTRVEVHLDRDFRVLDTEPADGDGG
ncbi:hypothetical protein J113_04315 [Mycobacterium tuberculosis CAS/NITR204]|uniref:PepSY domain-containing protein n=1 Tax=Mycobacterium tuberculosis CAS/NITR204 TaxID=1310114 RepID=R4M351_MYCTX|nr:hypothetical protein J113_04315 [Mycobacterium tuberculosis CAS/NITR204]